MTEEKVADVAAEGNGKEEKAENGAKSEPMDEAELESAIIRQVEYYFGDLNLPRDKFLREQVKLDDGWIPFEILIKFNRLAKLTTDLELIAKLLGRSRSGLLEISEDNKKVRRSPDMPLPEMNEERRKEVQGRTVYAKGFPKDAALDAILTYFKQFEEVENVIMRRYQDNKTKKRLFKGSVFATFKTKEQAQKFLEQSEVKYGENDLIRKWQEAYLAEKQEEYAAKKEKKDKKPKKEEQEAPQEDFQLPKGTVLHIEHGNDKIKREDIKEGFAKFGDYEIAYVDSNLGDTQGWVRFAKENAAKEVFEKIPDGKLTFADTEVTVKLLGEEEEAEYLTKTIEHMKKRRFNYNKNKHQNKGRNFKGRQGGKKRKQDQHDDAPAQKVKADS
ncbi:la protein homolog isoform X2 [Leguminivora glycinivorella]|uniref:la protein homolog isoform X2 n=1 Tax=Leguminivora glycinivorella TaxID=1035111 RepID=UPI00201005C1|nr:la protein homolog isoform X2 [Leguminivora glycinivorella]